MASVQDVLKRKGAYVAQIGKERNVLEAARQMNSRRIGALVVTEDDRVIGMFTERDILTRVVTAQLDPAATTVEQVMTSPVACCRPDTDLDECRGIMTVKRIRHLPVIDQEKLVGIITIGDLMALEVGEHEQMIKHLEQYIYGPYK